MNKQAYLIIFTALAVSFAHASPLSGGGAPRPVPTAGANLLHGLASPESLALMATLAFFLLFAYALRLSRRAGKAASSLRWARQLHTRAESELAAILSTLNSLIFELDSEGRILRHVPTRNDFGGHDPELLVGRSLESLVPEQTWKSFAEVLERVLRRGQSEEVEHCLEISGSSCAFLITVSPFTQSSVLIVGRDISQRKQYEDELARHAFLDSMTGLPNRALLLDRLERAMARTKRREGLCYAVMYIDLDRYKLITESLGHTTGDALIRASGQRIEGCLRKVDTVARFLGNEFVLLLDEIPDQLEALRVAERIRDVLDKPFVIEGNEVYTTASIGIAYSAVHYQSPNDIVRDAHTAMQWTRSKTNGGCKVFHSAMHERAMAHLQLETDMRKSLAELSNGKQGENGAHCFSVHYQPIFSLKNGFIVGTEALARWRHPLRGHISPGDFIPLAEETGLILQLGSWVLHQACQRLASINAHRAGLDRLHMNVNISARQLQQKSLAQIVKTALERSGTAPELLHLELTESMVMCNPTEASAVMRELKDLGVCLAIDDFGTGYSSLSHLYQFPFDILKIDRSFISRLELRHSKHSRIIEAIVAMAHSLEMRVVAEGVEDELQCRRLRELGCCFGQGYHFAPPMDAAALQNYMAHQSAALPPADAARSNQGNATFE